MEMKIGVIDMEGDKVADMVLKFPYEDFTDVTVAIGDTCTSKTDEFSEKFRRGGGGHFQSKNLCCKIWTFEQGFFLHNNDTKGYCFSII